VFTRTIQRKAPQMRDTTLPPVRVEAEFKERLTSYAATQDRDVSWVIRKAVEEYLARHEDKE
jgi:predicted transcriptional regulator